MHVGFSGTQRGMTQDQIWEVSQFLDDNLHFSVVHHGLCIGADHDFHRLSRLSGLRIVGHPPINTSKMVLLDCDELREPKEYLERNRDIVDESELMIFTPQGFKEELRSGTWSTVRYTKAQKKPGIIFWPDGTMDDA